MPRPNGINAPSTTRWPSNVLAMAGLFALICFSLQAWRLYSLSATFGQRAEIRQGICLIVGPIKLTLSLTTSTQAVLCISFPIYTGARSAPL